MVSPAKQRLQDKIDAQNPKAPEEAVDAAIVLEQPDTKESVAEEAPAVAEEQVLEAPEVMAKKRWMRNPWPDDWISTDGGLSYHAPG